MCVNDIACAGGEPLFFLDYIACGKNYPEKIASIVKGVAEGCLQSDAALIGGETAEHPGLMPEDEYDLAGFAVGVCDKKDMITGENLAAGDVLIGMASTGVHSNGFSLVRKVFDMTKDSLNTWQEAATSGVFGGIGSISSPIFMIFLLILMGYAVIKVFFANLKRGGILLIQIAVGSLYLFSVPRGYIDGFVGWCKQVIGLCLTAFLQATVLIAGLMVVKDQALLGLGLMLSAGEIPRIAGQFGLETGTKANVMGAVYAAQGAMNLTRTVVQVVSK